MAETEIAARLAALMERAVAGYERDGLLIFPDDMREQVAAMLADAWRGAMVADGLSIGYRTVQAGQNGNSRVIEKADLWEVSVVTFPMNEMTAIEGIKADEADVRDIERVLKHVGFSQLGQGHGRCCLGAAWRYLA